MFYRSDLRKPVSIKRTKYIRKSWVQNLGLCSKCPPFTRTHALGCPHLWEDELPGASVCSNVPVSRAQCEISTQDVNT